MLHIKTLDEGLEIFKALGSEIRIQIIKTLLTNNGMNMNELASSLNITNSALTNHIKSWKSAVLSLFPTSPPVMGTRKSAPCIWTKYLWN